MGSKWYIFGENGVWQENANGLCDAIFAGKTEKVYAQNGICIRAGLVQDAEGNYYYINSSLKAVKNCTYAFSDAMANGLLPAGTYKFGADGKMIR